jgi:hypothetical protein
MRGILLELAQPSACASPSVGVLVDGGAVSGGVVEVTESSARLGACVSRRPTLALERFGAEVDLQLELVGDVALDPLSAPGGKAKVAAHPVETGHKSRFQY